MADDILDADLHRYIPLTWSRPDGTPVKYVKRAPCSGAWADELVVAPDRSSHSIERIAGPLVARWQQDTQLWASPDDVEPLRTVKAGEVATEADMRLWLADRVASLARAGAGPTTEECMTKFDGRGAR